MVRLRNNVGVYRREVMRLRPDLRLPLNGNALDFSSSAAHGTPTSVTFGTPGALAGEPNTAATFNGSSSFIAAPSGTVANYTGPHTSLAWVKLTGTPSDFAEIIDKESGNNGYSLLVTTGRVPQYYIGNGTSFTGVTDAAALTAGTWYLIAGVYDGTNIRLYVNGVAAGTPVAKSAPGSTSGQALQIGRRQTGVTTDRFIPAVIGEVALIPSALTTAQLTCLYRAGKGQLAERRFIPADGGSLLSLRRRAVA